MIAQVRALPAQVRPFRLTRWFAVLSLASIVIFGVATATLLSRLMGERMLHRTGEVNMEFVHSLVRIHDGVRFFPASGGPAELPGERKTAAPAPPNGDQGRPVGLSPEEQARLPEIERVFGQVARMQGVLHANLYDRSRRVLWSTNRAAIGRQFDFNPELAEALDGELVIESDLLNTIHYIKPEHVFLKREGGHAVENYIPVFDAERRVVGVVELYMSPQSLVDDVVELTRFIWIAAGLAAAFLFLVLMGIVLRADALILSQQNQLVAAESMSAVGEMASAVAHGIRNPLASIRSSAELIVEDGGPSNEQANDIVQQVDRLEGWVRRLLSYAYQGGRALESVDLNALVQSSLTGFGRDLERLRIELALDLVEPPPMVAAERDSLEHALMNLVANAIDAMPEGGRLSLSTGYVRGGRRVRLQVTDTGIGMSAERLARIFMPFHTTKRTGMGVGTPLVKRTVERLGGTIEVSSSPGAGTRFVLEFPLKDRAGRARSIKGQ
ncbi:MAG TPA: ATP-binding protein [Burkholderiaceae bacterium]|jgi:signal transduction histidine kinase|nr:ATP-binding protein [Burkholderiaceae bacterium]